MLNKNYEEFVRFGGLSSVKQRGYTKDDKFHSPPTRHGLYAFPSNNIEMFLLGGNYANLFKKGTSNKIVYVKDKRGNKISNLHPEWNYYMINMNSNSYFTIRTNKLKQNVKQNEDGEYDYDDYIQYVVKYIKPKKFKYNGNIWHHLKEFVDPRDIIKETKWWVYTTMDVYKTAFKKNYDFSKKQMYSSKYHGMFKKKSFDNKNYPKNPLKFYSKDHLEVYIDGNDVNKII